CANADTGHACVTSVTVVSRSVTPTWTRTRHELRRAGGRRGPKGRAHMRASKNWRNPNDLDNDQLDEMALRQERAAANGGQRARLNPLPLSELASLPPREPLITGLLDCTAMSVTFGPTGCGKTFFALDIAFHVAPGRPWRGRDVRQGTVLYVAP